MSQYVKGAEPDRWHWIKDCRMYPLVVIQKKGSRPVHDLCDECQEIERKALLKTAPT